MSNTNAGEHTTSRRKVRRLGRAAATVAGLAIAGIGTTIIAGPAGANQNLGADDTVAPVANPVRSHEPLESGWQGPFELRWNWTDDGSGIDPTRCDQDPVRVETAGVSTIEGSCTDNAGNTNTASVVSMVDWLPPTVEVEPFQEGDTEVVFSAVDDMSLGPLTESGVDRVLCKVDRGDYEVCESPFDITGLSGGRHTIDFVADDLAGNRSEEPASIDVILPYPPLPSGSITVDGVRIIAKRNGDVVIIGGNDRDEIYIGAGREPGHLGIGLDDDGEDGKVWSGPVRNVTINTRNGDDLVEVHRAAPLPGTVSINAGNGANRFRIGARVDGRVTLRTGRNTGSDSTVFSLNEASVGGSLTIIGSTTDDEIRISSSRVAGKLSIRAGRGNNHLVLTDDSTVGALDYRGLSGTDELSIQGDLGANPRISTDGGADSVGVHAAFTGRMVVNLGSAADRFELSGVQGASLNLKAGSGDDNVYLEDRLAGNSLIDGGAGSADRYAGPTDLRTRNFEIIGDPDS